MCNNTNIQAHNMYVPKGIILYSIYPNTAYNKHLALSSYYTVAYKNTLTIIKLNF